MMRATTFLAVFFAGALLNTPMVHQAILVLFLAIVVPCKILYDHRPNLSDCIPLTIALTNFTVGLMLINFALSRHASSNRSDPTQARLDISSACQVMDPTISETATGTMTKEDGLYVASQPAVLPPARSCSDDNDLSRRASLLPAPLFFGIDRYRPKPMPVVEAEDLTACHAFAAPLDTHDSTVFQKLPASPES